MRAHRPPVRLIPRLLLAAASALLAPGPARAVPSAFDTGSRGYGIVIGEPAGAVFKLRLKGNRAVDAGIVSAISTYFFVHSDYLFHLLNHRGTELYAGIGGGFLFSGENPDGSRFGESTGSVLFCGRIPVGLEYAVPDSPVGVYLEGVPNWGILPSFFSFFQAGIGIRVYQ